MNHPFLLRPAAVILRPSTLIYLLLISVVTSFSSCIASRMVPHDAKAYSDGQAIKNDALNLMSLANRPYADSETKVTQFQEKLNDHIAYEEGRGEKNKTTVDMWKLLSNPDGNLLGGFLTKWKTDGKLSDILVNQFKKEVGENFNKILSLENKKKK